MALGGIFSGVVRVQVISASIERLLTLIQSNGIILKDVQTCDVLTARFNIHIRDYKNLTALLKKRGDAYKIVGKHGLFWALVHLVERPVLTLGVAAFLFSLFYLPTRVLFVTVEGNQSIATQLILDKAELCGIRFGASRRDVRSEKMKNSLLQALPELKWAGINTYGCTAVISVHERVFTQSKENNGGVCSIIAARDGVIRELTVTAGSAQCAVGQVVQAGQLLVSGYTDCGLAVLGLRAKAEILAQTTREVEAYYLPPTPKIETIDAVQLTHQLLFGKKLIKLWKYSGNSCAGCGKLYLYKYLILPGGFRLPVALVTEKTYCPSGENISEPMLSVDALMRQYLSKQMIAGQILDCNTRFDETNEIGVLDGTYYCLEMIGEVKEEEILIEHEQGN